MTDAELIEAFDERSAIRFYCSITSAELDAMTPDELASWARTCDGDAYYDLRRLVGPSVPMPDEIRKRATKWGNDDETTD